MKLLRSLAIPILVIAGAIPLQAFDFNRTEWGMKMEEVRGSTDEELLFYEGRGFSVLGTDIAEVFGRPCITLYFFSHKGNLVKGGYFFRPGYPDPVMYESDFDRLAYYLSEIYGEKTSRFMWHTTWYYEPRDYMKAVKNGHLTMMYVWETETTFIELTLSGETSGLSLTVQFFSKALYGEYVEMLLERAVD
jgi:hypothetical protein